MFNKQAMLANEQARLDEAITKFNLAQLIIQGLPSALDIEIESLYSNGRYADATLSFNGVQHLNALIGLFPPEPCLLVEDGFVTVRPLVSVQSFENGKKLEAFPVYAAFSNGMPGEACWWSRISGKMVHVRVIGITGLNDVTPLIDLERMAPVSLTYATGRTTYWTRKRKVYSPTTLTSRQAWNKEWEDWGNERNYTQLQKIFLNGARAWVAAGRPVSLPTIDDAATRRWCGTSGNFSVCFTKNDAQELVEFAQHQGAKLPSIAAETQATLATAEDWFKNFFGTRGFPGDIPQDLIRYLFHKETGFLGSVNWAKYYARDVSGAACIEVQYMMDTECTRFECSFDASLPAIDWDSLYEYH